MTLLLVEWNPMSVRCPKCGSGNVVGYMGEWECMDCGHRFRLPTSYTVPRRADIGKRSPVGKLIMVAVALAVLPWLIIFLIPLLDHSKNVGGILATIASSLFIVFGFYILFLILYAILRIASKR
jgi:quinol-cytochrome oxidoreductase complex cytochrome b subunit